MKSAPHRPFVNLVRRSFSKAAAARHEWVLPFHSWRCAAVALTLISSGCSTVRLGEQGAAESPPLIELSTGDYEILSCEALAVLEVKAQHEFKRANAQETVGLTQLAGAQLQEITRAREARQCSASQAARTDRPIEGKAPASQTSANEPNSLHATATTALQTSKTYIQVGAFRMLANATHAEKRMQSQGFDVLITVSRNSLTPLYYVRVGPFTTAAERTRTFVAAHNSGFPGAFLVDG